MIVGRPGVTGGVSRRVIINHVVDIDRVCLAQWLAVVRVRPDVSIPSCIVALHMGPELLVDRIRDDRVLHRERRRMHCVNAVPLSKLHRDMIKDHIVGRARGCTDIDRAGSRAAPALPKPEITANDVVVVIERNLVVHHPDTPARRRLTGNCDTARANHRAVQIDVTAHIENNGAISLTHRVAKGTRAAVRQRGHMVDRAAPPARGVLSVPLRPGKGELLRLGGG